jgi:hypothetical protein
MLTTVMEYPLKEIELIVLNIFQKLHSCCLPALKILITNFSKNLSERLGDFCRKEIFISKKNKTSKVSLMFSKKIFIVKQILFHELLNVFLNAIQSSFFVNFFCFISRSLYFFCWLNCFS